MVSEVVANCATCGAALVLDSDGFHFKCIGCREQALMDKIPSKEGVELKSTTSADPFHTSRFLKPK